MNAVWVAALVIIVVLAVAFVLTGRGISLQFDAPMPADYVVSRTLATIGRQRYWSASSQTPTGATFAYEKGPGCFIALFLLCVGLIPGILYLFFGRTSGSLILVCHSAGPMTRVEITGQGSVARTQALSLRRYLTSRRAAKEFAASGYTPAVVPAAKTCPRCAESVKAAAKVCRFCGYEFPEPAQPAVGL